jgi:starch-binding outer membrane protein, SusD/RagB family
MKKISILFAVMAFTLGACSKWLEEKPLSVITTNQYYRTAEDAEAAVNAIYAFVYSPYNKGGFDDLSASMLDIVSGQYVNKSQSSITEDFYNLRYNSASPYLSTWWNSSFTGIEAANLAIANIPNIEMDNTKRSSLLGQALFLRAYFYYNLVNIFGDVPLKRTPTAKPEDGLLPKTSVKEIYEQSIVADLKEAESASLPAGPDGSGRVSVGAVKTLLAKVYLSMAGQPVNEPANYALAKAKAQEVISSATFALFQNDADGSWFDKLNNPAFDNRIEHIFSINYTQSLYDASHPVYFLPKEVKFLRNGYIQFGGFAPSDDFLGSYAAADLRGKNNQGFYYNSIVVDGKTSTFPWAIYKFYDPALLDVAPQSGKDFPLLRYADLLLTFAEAQNEADGSPSSDAYSAVNALRTRAGLPAVAGLSKAAFTEEVWKERYWELSAETKHWFDIVRTRKAFKGSTGTFVDIIGYKLPSGASFAEDNLKFPIPLAETQINPLLK